MPEIREHHRFGLLYMLVNAAAAVPFVPVFVFLYLRASHGNFDVWFWTATGVFVAGGVFGLWWQARRSRRMNCPQCDALLVRTHHPSPGRPISFACPDCDVEWVTGLRESDD